MFPPPVVAHILGKNLLLVLLLERIKSYAYCFLVRFTLGLEKYFLSRIEYRIKLCGVGQKHFSRLPCPHPGLVQNKVCKVCMGFWSSNGWCFICQVGFQGEKSVESKTRVSCVAIFSGGYFCISVISVRQINWKKNKFKPPKNTGIFWRLRTAFFSHTVLQQKWYAD